jgi:hypothetical protein
MATAKTKAVQKPLIQIDDLVREMTDDEFAAYESEVKEPALVIE